MFTIGLVPKRVSIAMVKVQTLKIKSPASLGKILCDGIRECSDETTFHGIKYLVEPKRTVLEKIWWTFGLVICTALMLYFIGSITLEWLNTSVLLVRENKVTLVSEIPFPAITICPGIYFEEDYSKQLRQVLFSPKSQMEGELVKSLLALEPLLTLHSYYDKRFYDDLNLSIDMVTAVNSLIEISMNRTDEFRFVDIKNSYNFTAVLTEFGVCFSYNILTDILKVDNIHKEYGYFENKTHTRLGWDPELGYLRKMDPYYPRRHIPNIDFQDLITLFIMARSSWPAFHNQFKIAIHSPTEFPVYKQFSTMSYDSKWQTIEIEPKLTTTQETLKRYSPKTRGCYFENENPLEFFNYYNGHNCILECISRKLAEKCNCSLFALPRGPQIKLCNRHDYFCYETLTGLNYAEYFAVKKEMEMQSDNYENKDIFSSLDDCNCLPACVHYHYDYKIKMETNTPESVEKDGLIIKHLSIYYKSLKFYAETRTPLHSVEETVSEFGGLVGLFLGGSVLSLFEIGFFCRCCKSKEDETDDEQVSQDNKDIQLTDIRVISKEE